jgi:hypothetical protein
MAATEPRNQVIDISEGTMRAIDPVLAHEPESDFEPEAEALDILMEDLHTSYSAIVKHLDTCIGGLKEMEATRSAAAKQEIELTGALERAQRSARFGAALLAELEKLDATGRAKVEVSELLSNGHTESLPTGSS